MATETKSVFLYGKPTQTKQKFIQDTQNSYTDLINGFIEAMVSDSFYFLDLLNNNKKSSLIRSLEKEMRSTHDLGSAFGQNAIDYAVKELHNHLTRIKNKLYGFCMNHRKELLPYVESIALLNASILNLNEINVLQGLLENEKAKEKPSASKITFYNELITKINTFTEEERQENKSEVRMMFYEKLESWKVPYVKKASVQLDSRLFTIEKATNIQADYVLSFKVEGTDKRIDVPIKTSANSLRRLSQYKNGSPVFTLINGMLKVSVPVEKKIKELKTKAVIGMDIGITDLIHASNEKSYGTFSGMNAFYEEVLEPKLKNRSSLRNKMRQYQRELRQNSTHEFRKQWLRERIFNIANSLNGQKKLKKYKNKYTHEVNHRLNSSVKAFVQDVKKIKALVAMESLDITEFDRGAKANKRDSSWIRGKLTKKIQELLTWNGIPFVEVDPAYTSKACPKCFHIHDDNRVGKKFVCTVCKHESDADYNASVNIKERASDKELHEIVRKYSYNTKKRHAAIKTLFKKRHEALLL